jgi:hypothetical protein
MNDLYDIDFWYLVKFIFIKSLTGGVVLYSIYIDFICNCVWILVLFFNFFYALKIDYLWSIDNINFFNISYILYKQCINFIIYNITITIFQPMRFLDPLI